MVVLFYTLPSNPVDKASDIPQSIPDTLPAPPGNLSDALFLLQNQPTAVHYIPFLAMMGLASGVCLVNCIETRRGELGLVSKIVLATREVSGTLE